MHTSVRLDRLWTPICTVPPSQLEEITRMEKKIQIQKYMKNCHHLRFHRVNIFSVLANLCGEDQDCQYVSHYSNHPNHALKPKRSHHDDDGMMMMMTMMKKKLTKATPSNQNEHVSPMAIISSGKNHFISFHKKSISNWRSKVVLWVYGWDWIYLRVEWYIEHFTMLTFLLAVIVADFSHVF